MKTQYEIRGPDLSGIFISFDSDYRAIKYWDENVKGITSDTHTMKGAVVVKHDWETDAEKETARLDFILSPEGVTKLNAVYEQTKGGTADWLKDARTMLDIARKSPPSTAKVIWPKP